MDAPHLDRRDIDNEMRFWVQQQQEDGGWRQLPQLGTDAYATGLTLYAFHEAGMKVNDPVYARGVAYLLRTQYANGGWFVKTRAFPVQPQFESGFPFGYHQWISSAATSWASLAIAYTLPDAGRVARPSLAFVPRETGSEQLTLVQNWTAGLRNKSEGRFKYRSGCPHRTLRLITRLPVTLLCLQNSNRQEGSKISLATGWSAIHYLLFRGPSARIATGCAVIQELAAF